MNDHLAELFRIADEATKAGHFGQAVAAYTDILSASGVNSKAQHLAHWGIGEIHLNNKNYREAETHLKKALALSPDEPIYHYLLGCTYRYMARETDAVKHLQRAVELDSSVEAYWAELGWVVGFRQDAHKGIEYLKKALAINPSSSKSLRDICVLYAKQQRWSEAMLCIEEAVKHDPDNEDVLRVKADIEHFKSEFERLGGDDEPSVG